MADYALYFQIKIDSHAQILGIVHSTARALPVRVIEIAGFYPALWTIFCPGCRFSYAITVIFFELCGISNSQLTYFLIVLILAHK